MPRLCAAILLVGLAAGALSRRRPARLPRAAYVHLLTEDEFAQLQAAIAAGRLH